MKRLLFSFAIMLFASAAATTAWGETSEEKFQKIITSALEKCGGQTRAINPRTTLTGKLVSAEFVGKTFVIKQKYSWQPADITQIIPLDKVGSVSVGGRSKYTGARIDNVFAYLSFSCSGGTCVQFQSAPTSDIVPFSSGGIDTCPATTNAELEKAFDSLIKIYNPPGSKQ